MKKRIFALSVVWILAACGSKVEGAYANGSLAFNFKSDGKVATTLFGTPVETPYRIEGDTIKFHIPGGGNEIVLTKQADGSLNHPALGKFVKK